MADEHGHKMSSWIVVGLVTIAAVVLGLALVMGSVALAVVGVVVGLVGVVVGRVTGIMDDAF